MSLISIVLESTNIRLHLFVFIYSSKKNLVRFSIGSKTFSLPGGPEGIPKGRRPVTCHDDDQKVKLDDESRSMLTFQLGETSTSSVMAA